MGGPTSRTGSPPGTMGGLGGGTFPPTDVLPAEVILGEILKGMMGKGMIGGQGQMGQMGGQVAGMSSGPQGNDLMTGIVPLLMNPAVLQGMLKNVQLFTGVKSGGSSTASAPKGGGQ